MHPSDQTSNKRAVVTLPPEQSVSVGLSDLSSALRCISPCPQRWEDVARCLAGLLALERTTARRRTLELFSLFSLCASRSYLHSTALPETLCFDEREREFMAEFVQLLLETRFRPQLKKEQQLAETDSFQFSTPIHVEWGQLDEQLLSSFWASSPHWQALRKRLPASADRVLVMHRGVGVVRARGMYLTQKVDLLLLYCLQSTVQRIGHALRLHWPSFGRALLPETNLHSKSAGDGGSSTHRGSSSRSHDEAGSNCTKTTDEEAEPAPPKEVRVSNWRIENQTLRSMLPNAGAVLARLFAVEELQEPMFEEVVVLYRAKDKANSLDVLAARLGAHHRFAARPAAAQKASSANAQSATTHNSSRDKPLHMSASQHYTQAMTAVVAWVRRHYSRAVLAVVALVKAYHGSRTHKPCNLPYGRNIFIKSYNDVPFADMELVLPFKQVHVRPSDAIQLLATCAAAAGSVALALWEAHQQHLHHHRLPTAVWALTWVLVARALQLWGDLKSRTEALSKGMDEMQSDKAGSSQEGVICKLVDEMADDATKEALLVYTMLLQPERPVLRSELAAMCQAFLEERFMLQSNFTGKDILPRLVDWGLVHEHKAADEQSASLQAVPLHEAQAILVSRWQACMSSMNGHNAAAAEDLLQPVPDLHSSMHHHDCSAATSTSTSCITAAPGRPISNNEQLWQDGAPENGRMAAAALQQHRQRYQHGATGAMSVMHPGGILGWPPGVRSPGVCSRARLARASCRLTDRAARRLRWLPLNRPAVHQACMSLH